MITVSPALATALQSTVNEPVDLYELYLDAGTLYYSTRDITCGGHHYLPYVNSRSEIALHMDGEFANVTVELTNVDLAIAAVLTTQDIEGKTLIIRKIDASVADDSLVLFSGLMERPSSITDDKATIEAKHILGSTEIEVPARKFSTLCGWKFKGAQCQYAGSEGDCNKSWSRCSALSNTDHFGGFRFVPHADGDDTPYDSPIPLILGRAQVDGIVICHEDTGWTLKALAALGVGTCEQMFYVRSNGLLVDAQFHIGQDGGTGSQLVDPRFPYGYPYHRLAYVGITGGSEEKDTDGAPEVKAIVCGQIVDLFNSAGVYTGFGWTDNPAWLVRHFLVLSAEQGGMGIPPDLIDNAVCYQTAAYCDELVEDTTNSQKIYLPTSMPEGQVVGESYRRYRSTGVQGADRAVDGPYNEFVPGVDDDSSTDVESVMTKRFTLNVVLSETDKAVDTLFKKLLPAFRGYLTQSKDGKIQIRCERPVLTAKVAVASAIGTGSIVLQSAAGIAAGDKLLIGAYSLNAEVLTVYSVTGNTVQFTGTAVEPHAVGEVIYRVTGHYADNNVIGTFEYPLSDRQPSTNRISVKYCDAPSGFETRVCQVNDYEHQDRIHKVNNEDLDAAAIDSFFQAYRIGQWKRAKARDLGKFVSFTADITASLHEIGDVIAVSGREVGLQAVPFQIIELSHLESDEVSIVAQLYSVDVYDDEAPQATVTVPSIFNPITYNGAPAGDLTDLSIVAMKGIRSDLRIDITGTVPDDGRFAGADVWLWVPADDDPNPTNPNLANGKLYPQGWHAWQAADGDQWHATLRVPMPSVTHIRWIIYAGSRTLDVSNGLIQLTSLSPVSPSNHTPYIIADLELASLPEEPVIPTDVSILSVVPTMGDDTATITIQYMHPHDGGDGNPRGSFDGVDAYTQDEGGNVISQGRFPYVGSYGSGDASEHGVVTVSIPRPAVLPWRVWIHLPPFSSSYTTRFVRGVINADGVSLDGVAYAHQLSTLSAGTSQIPTPTIASVTVERARMAAGSNRYEYRFKLILSGAALTDPKYGGTQFRITWRSNGIAQDKAFQHNAGGSSTVYSPWYEIEAPVKDVADIMGLSYATNIYDVTSATNTVTATVEVTSGEVLPPIDGGTAGVSILEYRTGQDGKQYAHVAVTFDPPDGTDTVGIWLYEGAPGWTIDYSKFQALASWAVGGSIDFWYPRPEGGARLYVCITASNAAKGIWQSPGAGLPVKYVDISGWALSTQISGFAITVETQLRGGVWCGRFKWAFTPPTDSNFWYCFIDRKPVDASFADLPDGSSVYKQVATPTESGEGDWWTMPAGVEHWVFRGRATNRSEQINSAAAPTVNVTVPKNPGVNLGQADPSTVGGDLYVGGGGLKNLTGVSGNIVQNPNFDDDLNGYYATIGAGPVDFATAGFSIDATHGYRAGKCLKVTPCGTDQFFSQATRRVPVIPGQQFYFKFRYASAPGTTWTANGGGAGPAAPYGFLTFLDKNGGYVKGVPFALFTFSTDYQEYVLTGFAPKANDPDAVSTLPAAYIQLQPFNGHLTNGAVYIDCLEGYLYPPDTPAVSAAATSASATLSYVNSESGGQFWRVTTTLTLTDTNFQVWKARFRYTDDTAWNEYSGSIAKTMTTNVSAEYKVSPYAKYVIVEIWAGNRDGVWTRVYESAATLINPATGTLALNRAAYGSYDTTEMLNDGYQLQLWRVNLSKAVNYSSNLSVLAGQLGIAQVPMDKAINYNAAQFQVVSGSYRLFAVAADLILAGTIAASVILISPSLLIAGTSGTTSGVTYYINPTDGFRAVGSYGFAAIDVLATAFPSLTVQSSLTNYKSVYSAGTLTLSTVGGSGTQTILALGSLSMQYGGGPIATLSANGTYAYLSVPGSSSYIDCGGEFRIGGTTFMRSDKRMQIPTAAMQTTGLPATYSGKCVSVRGEDGVEYKWPLWT